MIIGSLNRIGNSSSNLVKNYNLIIGTNNEDNESSRMHSVGCVVNNAHTKSSNFRSTLDFNDSNSATDDTVTSWMLESYYETKQYVFAAGISQWLPKDNDGNGTTNDLPNVGFGRQEGNGFLSALTATDQDVTRYQIGITKKLEENIQLKTELLFDDYAKTKHDTVGIMSFVNIAL